MYYNNNNISLARKLRKEMTPWESKLWHYFLKHYSPRIQRQKPILSYIVDFYCAKAKLIIELDGSGHCEHCQNENDRERTEKLESLGMKVIRFYNIDIDKNFYGVCSVIDEEIKRRI
ncbi:MAG: endonuclease domain-containing protein [Oscillospiraceae bacterium]|nr:endonuclease domain-containing protein [Oscillospiraceae bacterium]